MDKTGLAVRSKAFQHAHDHRLPLKSYAILQLDGKAFHTYTKGMERPFDDRFIQAMNEVAVSVLSVISNAKFAYVQSDEINIFVTDLGDDKTQAYFGNRINKVVSTASGTASAVMSRLYPEKQIAVLDARFFAVPNKHAVHEFFLWRQVDAIKNSVRSVAHTRFSSKQLEGKTTEDAKAMLIEAGLDWYDFSQEKRQGRLITRKPQQKHIAYVHKRTGEHFEDDIISLEWTVEPAPSFKEDPDSIGQLIP